MNNREVKLNWKEKLMKIQKDNFKAQEKKLKKYPEAHFMYEKIINHIKQTGCVEALEKSPISKMYGFEALKYDMSGYYSFNLNKNRGKIRLIFLIDREKNIVEFVFISLEHYEDFKIKLRKS